MKNIKNLLNTLLEQSSTVLSELRSDSLSAANLSAKMDARNSIINDLEAMKNDIHASDFEKEERTEIQNLLDKFERINTKIETLLKRALYKNQEQLASASRVRKADDKYRTQDFLH